MKTRHIFGTIAAALILTGMPACSDNYDTTLIPSSTPTTLSAMEGDEPLKRLDLNAGPDDITIDVRSNTRWAVECTAGGWCSLSAVNGSGDGSFKLSVLENMTAPRYCDVVLYKLNAQGEKLEEGKWTISVQQESSDVSLSPSSVEPFAAQPTNIQDFTIKANAAWTLSVEYEQPESPKFITITPKEGMEAGENGTFTGSSDASFSIRLDNNGTAAVRTARINLVSEAGAYSVTITQQASTYTFDVSPNSTRYIAAEGGTVEFNILSLSGWDITTNDPEWISFSRTSGTGGSNERETVAVTFSPNSSGRQRTSSIHFNPKTEGYVPVTVEVVQSGYDLMFEVSRADGSAIISEAGGEIMLNLNSRFNWIAEAPSWISVDPDSGNTVNSISRIDVSVQRNTTNDNRTGTVTITPLPTVFAGGITLDPSDLGIQPYRIDITQFGGREPAVSVPWLLDDYTHTSATVEFNFYSPFHTIVEAGLEWSKEDGSGAGSLTTTPADGKDATVTFELTGLNAATKYIARGYVVDSEGTRKYGQWSYPFSTAGRYPNGDDNPTPSR